MMPTHTKIAEYNKNLYDNANNFTRKRWRSKTQKAYDYYLDDQLSKKEIKTLEKAGMPTFTINRIMPIIEIMKFFATANSPKWIGVGVEGSDIDVAQVHTKIAEYIWRLSNGETLFATVILDALTKSLGYFHVVVDTNLDLGKGEVIIESPNPWDVIVADNSRCPLFRDAGFIMIHKHIARSQLIRDLPEFKNKIINASSTSTSFGDETYSTRDKEDTESTQPEDIRNAVDFKGETDEILEYYYTYYKTADKYWNIFIMIQPSEEESKEMQNEAQKQIEMISAELMVKEEEQVVEINRALQNGDIIDSRAQLEIKKARDQTLTAIQSETQRVMEELKKVFQRTEHKIVSDKQYKIMTRNPVIAESIERTSSFFQPRINIRCSVGDVLLYEKALDRKIQDYPLIPVPFIHTGTPYPMSAVSPLIGKQDELNKAHQITIHNANLSGSLRWLVQRGAINDKEWDQYSSSPGARLNWNQGFEKPEAIHPTPLNNAFFALVQDGKRDLEYMSGIYSSQQGDVSAQHDTSSGLLQQDEYGTRRIRAWMHHYVNPALEQLGKVVQQFAQTTYTAHKIFRLVNPNNIKDPENVVINELYVDQSGAIMKSMDYETAKFDVYLEAGTGPPINRWALLSAYERWAEKGLIDDIAFVLETDMPNKEEIVKRNSKYSKQFQQIEANAEQKKSDDALIATLQSQIVQMKMKLQVMSSMQEVEKTKEETKQQLKLLARISTIEAKLIKQSKKPK